MPSACDVDWTEVRRASEQGVPDEKLSEAFGVAKNAIKQRRFREKWITPAKLAEQAEIAAATAAIKAKAPTRNVTAVTGGSVTAPSALAVTAETLQERAAAYSLNVFNAASKLATQGLTKLLPPETWKEFAVADQVTRRAAGLDKVENQVIVANLGGWQAQIHRAETAGQFVEIEAEVAESESEDSPE